MEPRLVDAIGDYLRAHVERHGRGRTAAAFGVSRHTLWRFLERGQPGRALPQAVIERVGSDLDGVDAATQALLARPAHWPAVAWETRPSLLPERLEATLLDLCATPLATVAELASLTPRARLSLRGRPDRRPHRLAV